VGGRNVADWRPLGARKLSCFYLIRARPGLRPWARAMIREGDSMTDLVIEQTTEPIPSDLLLLSDPSEEVIEEYIHSSIRFIARLDIKIVGALVLIRTRPKTMEIMNVSVYEEYQNKGIGKQLINAAIEFVKENQVKVLEIGTGNPGVIQMMLYQKCGFRIVGIEFDYFRKNHDEKIYENGIECRDMIRMRIEF
jgi:ribosomal protein S18 acetylase RimI-like enzyme